jgi:hypothetical protein
MVRHGTGQGLLLEPPILDWQANPTLACKVLPITMFRQADHTAPELVALPAVCCSGSHPAHGWPEWHTVDRDPPDTGRS